MRLTFPIINYLIIMTIIIIIIIIMLNYYLNKLIN